MSVFGVPPVSSDSCAERRWNHIGAGAVVTGDREAGGVYAGVPARRIK